MTRSGSSPSSFPAARSWPFPVRSSRTAAAASTASRNRSPHESAGNMSSPSHELHTAYDIPDSPARTQPPTRAPLRVGLVEERWYADAREHGEVLASGIRTAAAEGARLVCLQELTLSPYFATSDAGPDAQG